MVKVYIHSLVGPLALFQLFSSDSDSFILQQDENTQTDISHNPLEKFIYYKEEYKENLVAIGSLIYEATLKDDELEEGFPIERQTQTKCSGVFSGM